MNDNIKAFPVTETSEMYAKNEGMDLRDVFAANAPEKIPEWFIQRFNQNESNVTYSSPMFRDEVIYFVWRYYYADQMMKQRKID